MTVWVFRNFDRSGPLDLTCIDGTPQIAINHPSTGTTPHLLPLPRPHQLEYGAVVRSDLPQSDLPVRYATVRLATARLASQTCHSHVVESLETPEVELEDRPAPSLQLAL